MKYKGFFTCRRPVKKNANPFLMSLSSHIFDFYEADAGIPPSCFHCLGTSFCHRNYGASFVHLPLSPMNSEFLKSGDSSSLCPQFLVQCLQHSRDSINVSSDTFYFISEHMKVESVDWIPSHLLVCLFLATVYQFLQL